MNPTPLRFGLVRAPMLLLVLSLVGCSPVYYGTLERFGVEKRDILQNRIQTVAEAPEKDSNGGGMPGGMGGMEM